MKILFFILSLILMPISSFAYDEWETIYSESIEKSHYSITVSRKKGKKYMGPNEKLNLIINNTLTNKVISTFDIKDPEFPSSFYGEVKADLFENNKNEVFIFFQAKYGGDGHYSSNRLKIFKKSKPELKFELIINRNLRLVKIHYINKNTIKVTGNHIETLCGVCGWMEAENKNNFEIPIAIYLNEKKPKLIIQFSEDEKKAFILRLEDQTNKNIKEQLSYGRKKYPSYAEEVKKRLLALLNIT